MTTLTNHLNETTEFLKEEGAQQVDFGLTLGSGLGELANEITDATATPFSEIPHFSVSTVVGHAGQLVYGAPFGKKILATQGRFHYYEGHSMQMVTYPVRVVAVLGIHSMIVTDAAGGVNETYTPGNLMLINDHINFTGDNPLIGENDEEIGPYFPDMSHAYTQEYREVAKEVATEQNIDLKEGVCMGSSGPTYEAPAEVRMSWMMGADAVGMSTVSEVIVAVHSGMKVPGIPCTTNSIAGMRSSLNHTEVAETTERVEGQFKELVKATLAAL